MRTPIQVTIHYFDGCPNWKNAEARVRQVIEELGLGDRVTISFELVAWSEGAEATGFRGSPTVLIDGADPFANDAAPAGLSCRVYTTEDGFDVTPSKSQLREALKVVS